MAELNEITEVRRYLEPVSHNDETFHGFSMKAGTKSIWAVFITDNTEPIDHCGVIRFGSTVLPTWWLNQKDSRDCREADFEIIFKERRLLRLFLENLNK